MNIEEFKKLVRNYTEENITFDEPHAPMRCEENNLTIDNIKNTLLNNNSNLVRLVQDRPGVYKLYYRLSRVRELKIIIDLHRRNRINVRTVKVLNKAYRVESFGRRRF